MVTFVPVRTQSLAQVVTGGGMLLLWSPWQPMAFTQTQQTTHISLTIYLLILLTTPTGLEMFTALSLMILLGMVLPIYEYMNGYR